VTQIDIKFGGPLDAGDAEDLANYVLLEPGKRGSFQARNAKAIKLKSAVYDSALDEVILTPRTRIALTKPFQLTINGTAPNGLHDTEGLLIDAGNTGRASNDVVVISKKGLS
jgi:hypothetical protein